MIQLLYCSEAKENLTDAEIAEILEHSRQNNKQKNISGILVYNKGHFLQVLEGEPDAVLQLYETIAQDNRHHSVDIIMKEEIQERNFAQWSMAFNNLGRADLKRMDNYSEFLAKDFTTEIIQNNLTLVQELLIDVKNNILLNH